MSRITLPPADRPDYFDAKEAVKRLEDAIGQAVIRPEEDGPMRPVGEHVLDLGPLKGCAEPGPVPKESMAEYVMRRRSELDKQMEELAFLQDVAELIRKHPKFFGGSK